MLTGEICFLSIGQKFKAKSVTYRDLAALARLGYLKRTGEGRYCVYYRIVALTKKKGSVRSKK
jgi:DNA-binding IclR family transcriptional regulator